MKFTPVKDFDQYRAGQTYTEDDAKVQQWIAEGKVREAGAGGKAGQSGVHGQAGNEAQRGTVGATTTGTRDSVTGADPNEGPRDSVTGQPAAKPQQPTGGQTKK